MSTKNQQIWGQLWGVWQQRPPNAESCVQWPKQCNEWRDLSVKQVETGWKSWIMHISWMHIMISWLFFLFFICCLFFQCFSSSFPEKHPSEVCTPTSMLMPHKFHSFGCGFIVHSLRHQQGSTDACFSDSVVAVGCEVVSLSPPFQKIRWILHHMSFALHCALPKRWMMAMKPGSWIQSLLLATKSIYTFIIQNRKLMYHIIHTPLFNVFNTLNCELQMR